jgi:hypothetical protein
MDEGGILIGNTALDELFEIFKNKTIEISRGNTCEKDIIYFQDGNPKLEFILEEKNKELVIYKNQVKYKELKENYNELQKKYLNLRARYINQNDELLRAKLELSKERGEINDIKRS